MAYPYADLPNDKTNADPMVDDHAPGHNEAANALNDLKPKIAAMDVATTAAVSGAASALATHSADTTSVHGITDTAALYQAGGTDVAVADGGTGSSTAAAARTALGVDATGTAVLKTLIDAAGDLIVGTAADTAARMAMGSALQVLRVNTAGTALEYAAPDAGGFIPDTGIGALTRTARYVGSPPGDYDSLAPDLNRVYYVPIRFSQSGTIDRLRVMLDAAVATSVTRIGLYADHATVPHFPGALLVDGGTVSTASGQGAKEVTVSQAVTPGLYWRAVVVQTAVPYLRASGDYIDVVSLSTFSTEPMVAHYQDSVTGALPANATVANQVSLAPVIEVRFV